MARSRGFPRARASSGVSRQWGVGPGGSGITTLVATGSAFLGSSLVTTGEELTVMRTRGIVDMFIKGAGAADGDGFFGAVAIGKTTQAAIAAGITAVPTPLTESDWDGWFWHSFLSVHVGDISLGGRPESHQRIEVDSKAMRKFDPKDALYAVVEVVEIGTTTLNVFFDTRMLFQDSGR